MDVNLADVNVLFVRMMLNDPYKNVFLMTCLNRFWLVFSNDTNSYVFFKIRQNACPGMYCRGITKEA